MLQTKNGMQISPAIFRCMDAEKSQTITLTFRLFVDEHKMSVCKNMTTVPLESWLVMVKLIEVSDTLQGMWNVLYTLSFTGM